MVNWGKSLLGFSRIGRLANPRTYFYRLIWLGCISVCIPVILVSVAYYQISLSRMNNYIQADTSSSLTILKDRSERVLEEIEQESLQLAKDPVIQDGFTSPPDDNGLQTIEMLKKIALAKNSNSFINEIFLYNSAGDRILSNEYGPIARTEFKYKANIDLLLASSHPTEWTQFNGRAGYITFARRLPLLGTKGPAGVLGFELDAAALSKFLETDAVIVTDETQLIIVNMHDPFAIDGRQVPNLLQKTAELKGIQTIRDSDKSSGSFVAEGIDGKPAQYRYVKNVFARTYISVIPEQIITRQLNWIRKMTVLILLVFIGVGVLLTYLTSKKAYTPIEQLIHHSRSLSVGGSANKKNELDIIRESLDYLSRETGKLESYMKNMEKIEPSLREKFLYQLLGGDYARNEVLIQDCGIYGIEAEYTNVVLIVEAENIYKEKRFLPEDRGIIAFALANVMQEVLQGRDLRGYAIPYQGKGAAMLQFKPDMEQRTMLGRTMEYADAVIEAFRNYLAFEVTVGIGRFYAHAADVPVSCKEAENALKYRIFRDSEPVLYIEDVELIKRSAPLTYPHELATAVADSLDQEDMPGAVQHFRALTEILQKSQSYVFIYQGYHLLLSSLIGALEKQGAGAADLLEHNLFGQLRGKTTSKDISDWFEETLFPLYLWLTRGDRETAGESAVQTVCAYIKDNSGGDVSLVYCAEIVGVSPSYLSRLFKKKMGKNFQEYVAETKIAEAKRLLKDTDLSVSEVASRVGYSERNFIRIFHRYADSTPGNFRARHR